MKPEFRYTDLQDNIITASLAEAADHTWLIYPTEKSCKLALQEYQLKWRPVNISFLSMDEFKQKVVFSAQVRLQDEKRLVCLYQSMSPEDKNQFHIEKYPDLIDWGQHFFSFLEELAEECVDADNLLVRMDKLDFDFQPWQYENYNSMLRIRKQYQEFITNKGYTDKIFDLDLSNIRLPKEITRFVFVNQFYYTNLEKAIISAITDKQNTAIIYFHGKENWLDKESLTSRELNLEEAFPQDNLPFGLSIIQSKTTWQMALSFLANQIKNPDADKDKHFIIDAKFSQQPYHTVFSKDYFQFSEPQPLHETQLFHFFQIMAKGLDNLVNSEGRKLIKLAWLLQALGMEGFIKYFRPDWTPVQQDNLITAICKFSENDVLYLDIELVILHTEGCPSHDNNCADFLSDIMQLFRQLMKVDSIRQMIALIDVKNGIRIDALLSEQEKTCSNLPESFYEALANFMSLDELALVDNWQSLYPASDVAAGIFDLFLTFIKPKTYIIYQKETSAVRPILTNLMDTRNQQADKVSFLNLVEGELPSARAAVWLFNERQRKEIGLKTWEAIRSWERYYFYRLIASSQAVELYTVANQDKDIEPSSFINEIFLFAIEKKDKERVSWEQSDLPAQTLLLNLLHESDNNPLASEAEYAVSELSAFLNLPCDKQLDFGAEQKVDLSWSACEHFIKSSFVYYLRDVAKLKERIVRLDETMNRKMFGNLLHRYLSVITQRLAEQHQGVLSMKWEWINSDFLTANLKHALSTPILFYQIPKNYNWDYLKELLSPFLVDTARWFFQVGLAKDDDIKSEIITLIPENERMTDKEKQFKLLIKPEETAHAVSISIRGRADLRLETKAKRFIIDFKTGDSDKLQLLFYMWSYYLIDQPELESDVRAAIYKLLDKQLKWLDYDTKWVPSLLREKLTEALDAIVADGYTPATDAKTGRYYIDITRADLVQKLSTDEVESE